MPNISLAKAATVQIKHLHVGIKPGDGDHYWTRTMGIRTYDLNVDQIVSIVDKVGPKGIYKYLHLGPTTEGQFIS